MKLKKIVAPILATVILSQAVPALAVSQHPFTDVPTWANEAVAYSYEKGYVNGTTSTTYNSNGEISIVEFIKVMVQMCTTEDQRTTILEEAGATSEQIAADWTYQYRVIGEKIGLYDGLEQYAADKGETKCTRAVMAHILVNALGARNEDISAADAYTYILYLNDSTTVLANPYATDIGTAVSLGLISGDSNRNFNPDGLMDRASAAQVFVRLDNPNGERQTALEFINSQPSTTDLFSDGPIVIDMRTPDVAHREPREGDTIIRPDGSSVVLKRDATTGVLGYGQNVGAYLGTATQSGKPVAENGWTDAVTQGWSDQLAMGSYMKSPIAGQESTYHWTNEWAAIMKSTSPNRAGIKGTEGQVDSTGLWVYRNVLGSWEWQGPSC